MSTKNKKRAKKVEELNIPKGIFTVETETSIYEFGELKDDEIRSFFTDSCALVPRNQCKIITLKVGVPMELEYYPPVEDSSYARRMTTNVVSIKVP